MTIRPCLTCGHDTAMHTVDGCVLAACPCSRTGTGTSAPAHATPLELAERLAQLEERVLALVPTLNEHQASLEERFDRLIASASPDLPHCSVELSQNAKGSTQVQVKVYALASGLEAAAGQATALYDELRRQYHER